MKQQIWILATILISSRLLFAAGAESTCKPAEEGQPYSLQCEIPIARQPLVWKTGTALEDIYCQCTYNNNTTRCTCFKPGFSATVNVSGDNIASNFTINNPQLGQTGTTWTCASGDSLTYKTCIFRVFVKPTNVICQVQDPGPTSSTDVTVRCQPDDIFPATSCLFFKKTNDSTRTNLTPGTNGVTVETGDKECELRVPGTYLGRGDHQFGVVMYPNVTGGQADIDYGETSPDTTSIKIGDPSAELSQCPTAASNGSSVLDNYIKDGTNHACTCTRTDQTYFPVDISWESHTVPSQAQSSNLTFIAARNQAFTCSLTNSLLWTKEIIYRPQVAYGPNSVSITMDPPSQEPRVELCQDSANFSVQCQVSSSGVVPSATFSYTVNTTTSSVVPQTPTDDSTSTAIVTVTQGGVHGITCLAKNFKFEDISAQNTVSVVVREPPSTPSIGVVQTTNASPTSGDLLEVEEGRANVTCSVMGGYPQVTELRLSCGKNETFTNPGNQSQMSVNFTRNMNGQSCSCVATHDSTCYSSNTTSHLLNVLFPPAIRTFSSNGNSDPLTVEKGSTLTFVCEAEGNPGPLVSLQHDGRGDVTSVADGDTTVTKLTYSLTMNCLDTGVYTCTAQAREWESSRTVEIYVLCPQQLENTQSQNMVYNGQVNSTLNINITMYGYPKPTSLQLHGHNESVQQDDYAVTYTETRRPHGTVTLTFYSLLQKFFQSYTLNVTNTRGSLVYYFRIRADVDTNKQTDVNFGAVVGGGIAGIVVILVVALAVVFVKRRGKQNMCWSKKHNDKETDMHRLQTEHSYENVVPPVTPNETDAGSSYAPTNESTRTDGTPSYINVLSCAAGNETDEDPGYETIPSNSQDSPPGQNSRNCAAGNQTDEDSGYVDLSIPSCPQASPPSENSRNWNDGYIDVIEYEDAIQALRAVDLDVLK